MMDCTDNSTQNDALTERIKSSPIAEFFNKRSIFITGGAGFVGSVLLESILRCCSDVNYVYLLLREKKGLPIESRKHLIFQKRIFQSLKNNHPEVFTKVRVIKGDVTLNNLGISDSDLEALSNVSVVFHCAAVISFMKPLRYMIEQNVVGTENVLKFCRKLPKLSALVYTSTAYSNCNKEEIKEEIYRLSVPAEKFLEVIKSESSDNTLSKFHKQCLPVWPNTYTFSKAMAEDLISTEAFDLPVAIVRPSIIISSWKGPMPGYVEEGAGIVDVSIGIGKGFIRVLYCDVDKHIDIVPVDAVANTLIVSAWSIGTQKLPSPLVVNCTLGENNTCTWGNFITTMYRMNQKNPLPKMYQKPFLVMRKYYATYWASALVNHYAPAVCIDLILLALQKKPKLTNMYRFYDNALKYLGFFLRNEWRFKDANFKQLAKLQNQKDIELFPIDLGEYNVDVVARTIKHGAPFYQWEIDKRQCKERVPLAYRRYILTTFIKWTVIIWIFMFVAFIFTKSIFKGHFD